MPARSPGVRWFHREGVVFEATLRFESVEPVVLASLADGPPTVDAHVRLSRFWATGAGARFIGLAVRLHGGNRGLQDLLLLSSGPTVVGRRLFRPTDTPLGSTFYSSVLALSLVGERRIFGARVEGDPPTASFEHLAAQDDPGVTWRIEAARPWGPWFSVGLLDLHRRRPDLDVRFRPVHAWPGVSAGLAGAVRDRFYQASQRPE